MRISTKGRYGLRIMCDLAANDNGGCISLREISQRQRISVKYLEQLMPPLTNAGLIRSYRGNNGGYRLTRAPQEYTVGEILRATTENISPVACMEHPEEECPHAEDCLTMPFWVGLDQVIKEYADHITLADLVARRLP